MTEIIPIRALKDNYCYLLRREGSKDAAVIDPSEAKPVTEALENLGLELRLIMNTHHHHDHVGGNLELKTRWNAKVICSKTDFERVPGADHKVAEGDTFAFNGMPMKVIEIPGHTQGQIAFWLRDADALFVGDTLFAMGCGRLFEGTPEQMWQSLNRIMHLPPLTRLYFGHEYTERNAAFALTVDPENVLIQERLSHAIESLQKNGFVPAPTLQDEMKVNPFLRSNDPEIKKRIGFDESLSDLECFTELRNRRDSF